MMPAVQPDAVLLPNGLWCKTPGGIVRLRPTGEIEQYPMAEFPFHVVEAMPTAEELLESYQRGGAA